MRLLRLSLEEIRDGTVFRAERVITEREMLHFDGIERLILEDLEETIEKEIEKYERADVPKLRE